MGKSKDLASGASYVDTSGDTMTGDLGIGGTATDANWATATYGNREVAIDGGGGYGVLHLRGDGAGSTNTRYSMGVGDGIFYMAYDDVAGVHRIKVSSSGAVLKPSNPWFDAKGTGGWTTLAQYENILNVFNGGTVYQNSGGGFNSSTSTYTAPVSGRYCFLYNTYTKGGSTSTAARYLYPRLYVNNSPKQPRENIQHYNGENADEGRENTIMIDLAANDTVKAGVWSSHTDNQYYGSSFHLQMFFIG